MGSCHISRKGYLFLLRSHKKKEHPTNVANANPRDITLITRYFPFVLYSVFYFSFNCYACH